MEEWKSNDWAIHESTKHTLKELAQEEHPHYKVELNNSAQFNQQHNTQKTQSTALIRSQLGNTLYGEMERLNWYYFLLFTLNLY